MVGLYCPMWFHTRSQLHPRRWDVPAQLEAAHDSLQNMQKLLQSLVWRYPYLGYPESVLLAMVARQNLEMCVRAVQ